MPAPRATNRHRDTVEDIHAAQRQVGVTLQYLRRAAGMDDEYPPDPNEIPVIVEVLCHQHWALLNQCAEAVAEAGQIDDGAEMIGVLNNTRRLTPWAARRLLEMAGDHKALGRFDLLAGS